MLFKALTASYINDSKIINFFLPWLKIYSLRVALNNAEAVRHRLKNTLEENDKIQAEMGRIKAQNIALTQKIIENGSLNFRKVDFIKDTINSEFIRNEVAGELEIPSIMTMLNWPQFFSDMNEDGFAELIRLSALLTQSNQVANELTNFWFLFGLKNFNQLLTDGYKNFKRTIACNYYNFLVQEGDAQIKTLETILPSSDLTKCMEIAKSIPVDPYFPTVLSSCKPIKTPNLNDSSHAGEQFNYVDRKDQFSYNYFLLLLREYVKNIDTKNYLEQLEEPIEGNPLLISIENKLFSQDLANSLIEFYAIDNAVNFNNINTVLEIGGGYGRNAFVILSLNPKAKIVMVDIMPALYIAQRYLSSVFKNHTIFRARQFSSYDEVSAEINNSSIIFLLPHQLELLPEKQFDLCINISSFGEMNFQQIEWYFNQINRLTKGYFYLKQWTKSINFFDDLVVEQKDYPYYPNWKQLFNRNCVIQTEFFEALYQVE